MQYLIKLVTTLAYLYLSAVNVQNVFKTMLSVLPLTCGMHEVSLKTAVHLARNSVLHYCMTWLHYFWYDYIFSTESLKLGTSTFMYVTSGIPVIFLSVLSNCQYNTDFVWPKHTYIYTFHVMQHTSSALV